MRPATAIIACLAVILAAGCATRGVKLQQPYAWGQEPEDGDYSWHHLRLRWHWPEGEQPDWSLDLLAADLILSDLIAARRDALPLWRFHRRAARTPAGHQFSFIFYTTPRTARDIRYAVSEHPVTGKLMEQGLLEKVYLTRPDGPERLSATSDPGWPQSIQSTWPVFIMGVSQAWLALVEFHAGDTTTLDEDLAKAKRRYRKTSDKVDSLWFEHAQHAYMHHLSGVFGYKPVWLRQRVRF